MQQQEKDSSLKTLQDIHHIMERSTRFISLSGWSGVWAGCTALAGASIANYWLSKVPAGYHDAYSDMEFIGNASHEYKTIVLKFIVLALTVLLVAIAGGYYFTLRKAKEDGETVWNVSSKRMLVHMFIPLLTGGVFAMVFLMRGLEMYIAPVCLAFYGLALINGSKYTLSDIKYLGLLEVMLGCISLFAGGYGLLLWTIGFGILHILYGIIVWKKYDKQISKNRL